jgi:excisionase family DNA binding protein
MSGYITVAQVADDLDVRMRTVQRWVAAGALPAIRLPGGRLRIPQTAYAAFVAGLATPHPARTIDATPTEEE